MRKAISVAALILALTCSAYAGDMQNGVTGTPPPPPAVAQQETIQEPTADGYIPNGATDGLTETVLNLLAGVLAAI